MVVMYYDSHSPDYPIPLQGSPWLYGEHGEVSYKE
jgi:hypothetical protein